MGKYYPAGYYGSADERRFPRFIELVQNALYATRAKAVESVSDSRPGRVLDVGCGRGLLLSAFQRRGWQVQGTELSEQSSRFAREVLGIPVKIGPLETLGLSAQSFDAVTLWHVLEHVASPALTIAEANRVLRPGGVLLVGVPNFGGFEARFCRDKWFHLDVPRHITHLTEAALRNILHQNGFEPLRCSGFAPEYDVFSFVQSLLNRSGLRHNLLYNVLRGKQAKVFGGESTPLWQVILTLALAAPLGMLSLPATTLAGFYRQGGALTILARKRRET
jgi:SAM-dependent methyltransferase